MYPRLGRLLSCILCLSSLAGFSLAQQPAQNPQQQQPPAPPPQNPPAPPPAPNPFETVPQAQEPPKSQAPSQTLTPKKLQSPQAPKEPEAPSAADTIEAIEFRGARRVPQDTLRALLRSRVGDKLDDDLIQRDFAALWNSGRFDDLKVEKERGKTGWIVRWLVTERPMIRSITYEGNKSVSVSDILDRYKERKVSLTVESQYDPNKVQHAKMSLPSFSPNTATNTPPSPRRSTWCLPPPSASSSKSMKAPR